MRLAPRLLAMALAMALAEVPLENYVESEPAKSEEVVPEIREDITSERETIFDQIEGWFWERKKWMRISKARRSKHGLLDHFCGKELNLADMVISCDCCADHLMGDPRASSALLYQSGKEQAPAFNREADGTTRQLGMVNAWSLGGRVPAILCDRGRLVCHCEDPVRGWAEFEQACRRGALCEPPEEVEEQVSKGYEEQHQAQEEAIRIKEVEEQVEKNKEKEASSLVQNPNARARCEFGGRLPLGRAFCEDFSVKQCENTYARTNKGFYHICAVDKKTFRHCGAHLMTVEEAQERTNQSMSFAVQHFYSPELDWKVRTVNFTTTVVEEPWPPATIFQKYVQDRMDAQDTMAKLAE